MKFVTTNRLERLWLLAKIEFKLRYYENKLGLLWALIKPLTDIMIYYIAFDVVIKQNIPNYVSYLFIGLIVWNFFVESTTGTVQILKIKKFLYEYSNMQKIDIYISNLLSSIIGLTFNFTMFFIYFFLIENHGHNIHSTHFHLYFWLLVLFVNLFVLCLASSMVLSSLYVIMKDIHQIWQVVAGLLFILTPIIFRTEDYLRALPYAVYVNPMAGIIINFRKVILSGQSPDFLLMGIDFGYTLLVLWFGSFLLKKFGNLAAEKI
jgi:ABC-type polysaccharide/polyol phosphate export permease